tara:strand:- start:100 stop:465 length:366 start_codon:yes stop_codon:yes gene_type:complete
MPAHKTKNHSKPTVESAGPPAIGFDAAEFFHFVEETGWSDEQKAEYITLVWNIVCEFVAMGWGVHPIQQAQETCGQSDKNCDLGPNGESDVIDSSHGELIEEFVRRTGDSARSDGEGVTDG